MYLWLQDETSSSPSNTRTVLDTKRVQNDFSTVQLPDLAELAIVRSPEEQKLRSDGDSLHLKQII